MQAQIILGSTRTGLKPALTAEESHLDRVRTWRRGAAEMEAAVSTTH